MDKDYRVYISALRKCAKEHENDITSFGHVRVSDLCNDTANLLEEIKPKEGKWIKSCLCQVDGGLAQSYTCSECSNRVFNPFVKYCDGCGAKMKSGV